MQAAMWSKINRLGLGCMGMSEFYGPSEEETSLEVLEAALRMGINYFDTADMYGMGHNEELLGRFLKGRRDEVFLGTKFGIVRRPGEYTRTINNTPDYIKQALEGSLKRLGTDYVDIYFVHRMDPTASLEATMKTLASLREEGVIRGIGLSEVSAATLRAACEIAPVDVLQSEYSLMTRDVEEDILPTCRALGVRLMAYSPLSRGLLSGDLQAASDLGDGDFRRMLPRFSEENMQRNVSLLSALNVVAERHQCTYAQVCLSWVLAQDPLMMAIPGTRKLSRLEENVGALQVHLTEEDLSWLSEQFSPERVQGARYTEEGMKGVNV
ncbi:MAG: aldo/keto reductase [Myxococcales bacterium]|nr:aldo/keto reductase [Myxococcales bacterium]